MLIPTSARSTAVSAVASLVNATLCHTTSDTPATPSASPSHWRGTTRSPSQPRASSTVRIGCKPTSIAAIPADMPLAIATNTPPR
jgi:hypothetical protein